MNFHEDNDLPLSINSLIELESKIGSKLPKDFCEFLIAHNGGRPKNQFLEVPDCDTEVMVHYFFGIKKPNSDILIWLNELEEDLKDIFLPIEIDPGGNILLMDKTDGMIYYWDSARFFPDSSDNENAYWVANSFSDLLTRLMPEASNS